MRQDRENQFWTERLERVVVKWIRSLNSHTGPRRVNGRSSRPDTCQHPTTRPAVRKILLALRGASTHVQNLSHIWSGDGFGLRDLRLIERPHVHVALG